MTEAQKSAPDMARYMINREHGNGALFYGKDLAPITYTRTGLKSLDAATGGGTPRGHIVEIHGAEGTGKTSLALALAFRMGGPLDIMRPCACAYTPPRRSERKGRT